MPSGYSRSCSTRSREAPCDRARWCTVNAATRNARAAILGRAVEQVVQHRSGSDAAELGRRVIVELERESLAVVSSQVAEDLARELADEGAQLREIIAGVLEQGRRTYEPRPRRRRSPLGMRDRTSRLPCPATLRPEGQPSRKPCAPATTRSSKRARTSTEAADRSRSRKGWRARLRGALGGPPLSLLLLHARALHPFRELALLASCRFVTHDARAPGRQDASKPASRC